MGRDLDPPPFTERADGFLAALPPARKRRGLSLANSKANAFAAGACFVAAMIPPTDWLSGLLLVLAVLNALAAGPDRG